MPETFAQLFSSPVLGVVFGAAVIMGYLTLNTLLLVYAERKVSAWIQRRMGPTEVGPFGLLQTLADAIKLLSKQLIVPKHADKPLFLLAPLMVFAPVIASIAMMPFSKDLVVIDIDLGLVVVFALAGFGIIGIFMAGWGSNNKYALMGAMRSVAQNISYEIPLILSALAVVVTASALEPGANTLNLWRLSVIQDDHQIWFIVVQPVAAVIYFISALAETNRAPFDIPEAESELVAGFHTEYSGMAFSLFFFAEYTSMTIVSMVATVLFFGGFDGPLLPGFVWFFLKTYALLFLMIWIRWTYPRLRFDQLMTFCWAVLIPLSIVNLIATGIIVRLL